MQLSPKPHQIFAAKYGYAYVLDPRPGVPASWLYASFAVWGLKTGRTAGKGRGWPSEADRPMMQPDGVVWGGIVIMIRYVYRRLWFKFEHLQLSTVQSGVSISRFSTAVSACSVHEFSPSAQDTDSVR